MQGHRNRMDWGGHVHATFVTGCSRGWRKSDESYGRRRVCQVWSLTRQFAKCGGRGELAVYVGSWKLKSFQLQGMGTLPLGSAGAPPQTAVIGSRSELAMCGHLTFFDLARRRPVAMQPGVGAKQKSTTSIRHTQWTSPINTHTPCSYVRTC